MVEHYTKARPLEERRRAPSPFTAARNARKEKGPLEKWPSQQRSALARSARRENPIITRVSSPEGVRFQQIGDRCVKTSETP
jgi:hypothetical protein